MKKRNQIQEKIDSLKKQYTENALLIQDSKKSDAKNTTKQNPPKKTSTKPSSPSTSEKPIVKTLKQKQSGFFLALGGGAFSEASTIKFNPEPLYYDAGLVASGGALLLKLGGQKMWSNYVGGRIYLSGGLIRSGFVSGNVDLLFQIPLGSKVALGIYFGIGGGVLFANDTYKANYFLKTYQTTLKRMGMFNIPYGVSLAFGHSRIELGGMYMVGAYTDDGSQYNIKTEYGRVVNALTLSYQITF